MGEARRRGSYEKRLQLALEEKQRKEIMKSMQNKPIRTKSSRKNSMLLSMVLALSTTTPNIDIENI